MGAGVDAPTFQNLPADCPGKAQGSCQSAGKMSAAPHIIEAPVPEGAGIVRMSRPGELGQVGVIHRVGVCVHDHGTQRSAGGFIVVQTGHDLWNIQFRPGRGSPVLFRRSASQKACDLLQVDGFPRREIVDHHADGCAVGFAE